MQIRQLSIFLENKRGELSQICRALAEADVNIAAMSLADTSDFGIARMIVDDHEKAREVVSGKGYVVNVREVVAVCVSDRPGSMAEVMSVLDTAGVDIEYSYAFAFHEGEKAVLVFRFGDNDSGVKALAAAGYATLCEDQVGKISSKG